VLTYCFFIGAGDRSRTRDLLIANFLIINKLLIILEQVISGTLSLNRFDSIGYSRQVKGAKTGWCTGSVLKVAPVLVPNFARLSESPFLLPTSDNPIGKVFVPRILST